MGLRKCTSLKRNMNFLERKKTIKLSADLAMASTRNETTRWSRFLIVNASRDHENKALTEHIIGSPQCQMVRKVFTSKPLCNSRNIRSKKILKRSRTVHRVKKMIAPRKMTADSVAKRLVQKRKRMLKSLLPGGEFIDDVCLIEETLDYIQSLRAQVEVMRCLVSASELINQP